jgi:N6-L-threonylcarbamoyladenine synthase
MPKPHPVILAIESSCDETSAAVLFGNVVKSNIIATQKIHEKYGGVVPELASRAHQQNIVPVVQQAISEAGITISEIDVVACTQGPGLMGALQVGVSYSKSLSMALDVPLILVNHMQAHVLAHFISREQEGSNSIKPEFPFLCLTVSGGHTQIVLVNSPLEMKVVGSTIDDAAGEAFDKASKVLGLEYPGGPQIDRFSKDGDPKKFSFTIPSTPDLSYSFSGLKTSLLYLVRDEKLKDVNFVENNKADLCASYQATIVKYLLKKFTLAINIYAPKSIALAGGVSANSLLRYEFEKLAQENDVNCFIPPIEFTTDNAAMIGASAYFLFEKDIFSRLSDAPAARLSIG